LGFDLKPLNKVAALGLPGFGIPFVGAAAAELAAGFGFDDVAQGRTAFGAGVGLVIHDEY